MKPSSPAEGTPPAAAPGGAAATPATHEHASASAALANREPLVTAEPGPEADAQSDTDTDTEALPPTATDGATVLDPSALSGTASAHDLSRAPTPAESEDREPAATPAAGASNNTESNAGASNNTDAAATNGQGTGLGPLSGADSGTDSGPRATQETDPGTAAVPATPAAEAETEPETQRPPDIPGYDPGEGRYVEVEAVTTQTGIEYASEATPGALAPAATQEAILRARVERHRRETSTFLTIFLGVVIVGVLGCTSWLGWWSLPFSTTPVATVPCPTPTPTAAAMKGTSVRVYNATNRRGLAAAVSKDLQKRGFLVPVFGNAPSREATTAAAEVHYGARGVLRARTVAAQVDGTVRLVQDDRPENTVDLVLGAGFRKMRPVEGAKKLIALPSVDTSSC